MKKNTGMAILISKERAFDIKKVLRASDGHYVLINGTNGLRDTILKIDAPNTTLSKVHKPANKHKEIHWQKQIVSTFHYHHLTKQKDSISVKWQGP